MCPVLDRIERVRSWHVICKHGFTIRICSFASMQSVFAGTSLTAFRFDASTISRWKGILLCSDSESLSYKSNLLSKHSHHNPNKPKAVRETDITDQRDDDRPIFQEMRRNYPQHIVFIFSPG